MDHRVERDPLRPVRPAEEVLEARPPRLAAGWLDLVDHPDDVLVRELGQRQLGPAGEQLV